MDNGDIGDLISDYGNPISGYWAPPTDNIGPQQQQKEKQKKYPIIAKPDIGILGPATGNIESDIDCFRQD